MQIRNRIARRALFSLVVPILASVLGCETTPVPVTGVPALNEHWYTAHTLKGARSGGYEILYRTNFLDQPVVAPPGKPVEIQMYSSSRIDLTVDERPCRMYWRDFQFGTDPNSVTEFLEKHFVKNPADTGLDKVTDAAKLNFINLGKEAIGMSKEELILAIGYPRFVGQSKIPAEPLSRARILEYNEWWYRRSEFAFIGIEHVFYFGSDGTLISEKR